MFPTRLLRCCVIAYGILLSYLLVTPDPLFFLGYAGRQIEETADSLLLDQGEHVVAYAVLTLLSAVAYHGTVRERTVFALAVLHGALAECIQHFVPGREFGWQDAVANACGALLGLLAARLVIRSSMIHAVGRAHAEVARG